MEAKPSFLTYKAKAAFNRLQLAFSKASILQYFDLECYIWIENDALGYAIGDMLSQLASKTSLDRVVTKTDLGRWHPVAFYFKKIIPVKTQYKTHDNKLLVINESFKTWRHYFEVCN